MHHPARPLGRFGVFPSVVGVVAAVVALSPPANADPDLFEPPPSIVAGGTVQPGSNGSNIVVDPQTPSGASAPIDPNKPIGVDPRVRPLPPICCTYDDERATGLIWLPDKVPPVVEVDSRLITIYKTIYLDNHGRYWLLDKFSRAGGKLEQVGGFPPPTPPPPPETSNLPPGQIDIINDPYKTYYP
jgi:hypothetical protein